MDQVTSNTTPVHSANGWPVAEKTETRSVKIPDSTVSLRVRDDDDVAAILTCIAWWVDQHVEDIDVRAGVRGYDVPDDWGWAVRKIRGAATAVSNHASGTAIDLNAVPHPMGVRGTWSDVEQRTVRQLLGQLNAGGEDVVRWGEDYKSRPDGMHFELITTTRTAVQRAAARARQLMAPPTSQEDDMPLTDEDVERISDRTAEKVWARSLASGLVPGQYAQPASVLLARAASDAAHGRTAAQAAAASSGALAGQVAAIATTGGLTPEQAEAASENGARKVLNEVADALRTDAQQG